MSGQFVLTPPRGLSSAGGLLRAGEAKPAPRSRNFPHWGN
jgi:hypothetical protein